MAARNDNRGAACTVIQLQLAGSIIMHYLIGAKVLRVTCHAYAVEVLNVAYA